MLKDELDFFVANQDDLVKQHRGRVLVIKGQRVVAVYESPLEAYIEAQKTHELGTFMIQACEPGPEAYTVTLSSHGVLV